MIATSALLVVTGAVLVVVGVPRDGIAWELGAVGASVASLVALGFGVLRARRQGAPAVEGSHAVDHQTPDDDATP